MSEVKQEATGLKSRASSRWARLKANNPWLAHALRAYRQLNENHGNHYAAAITYFSFLALFPVILLAVSVLGFVLKSHPDLQQKLFTRIEKSASGGLGDTIKQAIDSAIKARAAVGITGLVSLILAGSGWIANLRAAIEGVWGQPPAKRSFLKAKLADLTVLAVLGVAIIASLGVTAVGTALTSRIVRAIGLDKLPGTSVVVTILGLAIAVAGDMLIFAWLLVRLPRAELPKSITMRGALLAAVGFEILKVIGTYTIAATTKSATAGPFAAIVAVLIWIQLVSRFLLYCAAWLATAARMADEQASIAAVPLVKGAGQDQEAPGGITPLGVAATLVGAGAAAGGGLVAWLSHRRRSPRADGAG